MLDELFKKIVDVAEIADAQGTELAKGEQDPEKVAEDLGQTLNQIEDRISEIRKIVKD